MLSAVGGRQAEHMATYAIGWDFLSPGPPRDSVKAGAGSWPAFCCTGGRMVDLYFGTEMKGGVRNENWALPSVRQRLL